MQEKTDHNVFEDGGADQLLRETLAGHRVEPASGVWKGISRKLLRREILHFNFTNVSPSWWLAGAAGALLVVSTLYFLVPRSEPHSGVVKTEAVSTVNPQTVTPAAAPMSTPSVATEPSVPAGKPENATHVTSDPAPAAAHARTISHPAITARSRPSKPLIAVLSKPIAMQEPVVEPPVSFNAEPAISQVKTEDKVSGIDRLSPLGLAFLPVNPQADTIITFQNQTGVVRYRKSSSGPALFYSAGLEVMPEYAFYTSPESYAKPDLWIDGLFTVHISRFAITTGAGFGYIFDRGNYTIGYKSLDSVGYYNSVTSYSIGNNNEIIYNTEMVGVYDSLNHSANSKTSNTYTYFQIPLLLGYRLYESGWSSLTFHAGPAVSFLLGSHTQDPMTQFPGSTTTSVGNETPDRVQTNWQLWTNLLFEMRLRKNLSLYLEPSFKYYLKPVVTAENVLYKAPWTLGIGVGLQFNFGHKKNNP